MTLLQTPHDISLDDFRGDPRIGWVGDILCIRTESRAVSHPFKIDFLTCLSRKSEKGKSDSNHIKVRRSRKIAENRKLRFSCFGTFVLQFVKCKMRRTKSVCSGSRFFIFVTLWGLRNRSVQRARLVSTSNFIWRINNQHRIITFFVCLRSACLQIGVIHCHLAGLSLLIAAVVCRKKFVRRLWFSFSLCSFFTFSCDMTFELIVFIFYYSIDDGEKNRYLSYTIYMRTELDGAAATPHHSGVGLDWAEHDDVDTSQNAESSECD